MSDTKFERNAGILMPLILNYPLFHALLTNSDISIHLMLILNP